MALPIASRLSKLTLMKYEPIQGKPVRFPPGRLEIRLNQEYKSEYRALYARYQSILAGLPVLRDRDFDGRPVKVTGAQLDALNRAFARLAEPSHEQAGTAFASQEAAMSRLFKRLQYLS
jgi:hypothetical protein